MERLDLVLVQQGHAKSRLQAKRMIIEGNVKVNNSLRVKPGQRIPIDAEIIVVNPPKYVSRGGMKLEKALDIFELSVEDKVAIDVGASTGGFTDCLLQHGAEYVYAVDVGSEQLAAHLRTDPRVQVLDKTNIRYVDRTLFSRALDIAVIDVSFISLQKVFPIVLGELEVLEVVALVKPQFEAGRASVKKGKVVDGPITHEDILNKMIDYIRDSFRALPIGLTFSPIHKDICNIEYLLWIHNSPDPSIEGSKILDSSVVSDVVCSAHRAFFANKIKE